MDGTMCRLSFIAPLFFLLSFSPVLSQVEFGGFFSAAGTWTTVNGSGGVLPSAGAGVVVNRHFIAGASLSALIPTIRADSLTDDGRSLYINLFFWQGRLEYIRNPDDFFQYGGALLAGAGSVGFRSGSADHSRQSGSDLPSYSFWLIEPEVAASLAFSGELRLRAALGWRFVPGRQSGSEPAGELSGPAFTLGFRIGWFGD